MKKNLYIIVHSSALSEKRVYDQFNLINRDHRDYRQFPRSKKTGHYVGYTRLVTGGKNYLCHDDSEIGAHDNNITPDGVSYNEVSLGIAWGGDGDRELPSNLHRKLLQEQIWAWQDMYHIPNQNVIFHRDTYKKGRVLKTCPGVLFNREYLDALLQRNLGEPILDNKKIRLNDLANQVSLLQQVLDLLKRLKDIKK